MTNRMIEPQRARAFLEFLCGRLDETNGVSRTSARRYWQLCSALPLLAFACGGNAESAPPAPPDAGIDTNAQQGGSGGAKDAGMGGAKDAAMEASSGGANPGTGGYANLDGGYSAPFSPENIDQPPDDDPDNVQ